MKLRIQNSFDKASLTYDKVALIQQKCANILTNLLTTNCPNFKPTSILDLGTGTGFLSQELVNYFPDSNYILNDISAKMLHRAKEKFGNRSNFNFKIADFEEENFGYHSLIASNMALQLGSNLKAILKKFSAQADIIAFNTLIKGTFAEWEWLYKKHDLPSPVAVYPTFEELNKYCISLKPVNYYFYTEDFTLQFNSAWLFAKYLRDLGTNSSSVQYNPIILKNFFKRNNQVIATNYKVFFVVLKMK